MVNSSSPSDLSILSLASASLRLLAQQIYRCCRLLSFLNSYCFEDKFLYFYIGQLEVVYLTLMGALGSVGGGWKARSLDFAP